MAVAGLGIHHLFGPAVEHPPVSESVAVSV